MRQNDEPERSGDGQSGQPETEAVHVVVTGRVQGVYFRASCQQAARAEDVRGWVRNMPDGSVEALFHGSSDAVDNMVLWCHHGPPDARVETVQADPMDLAESSAPSRFEIR